MHHTEIFALAVLICAVAVGLALLYNRITETVKIPAPVVFLLAAAVVSDFFPALEHVPVTTVQDVVTVALAVILFDGGMHIGWRRFRTSAAPIVLVGVAGTFLTTAAVAVLAHYVFGLNWLVAVLLGTALAPTDPAVVFSVLGKREIAGRPGTILEGESGANDPVGIALMASVLAVATTGASGFGAVGAGVLDFVLQMVIGTAIGIVGGGGLLFVMRHWPLPSGALYPLRTLAGALAIYGVATIAHGSGFLAVFIAGILLGDARAPYKKEVERFHSALASLGEIVAFTVLGLTISLAALSHDGSLAIGVGLAALLAFVVRPLLVGGLLLPIRLRHNERAFILWAGLKGAVPILLGTFAFTAGIAGAHRLYDIIFVVVAFSVIVQGGLVPTIAGKLGVPMRTVDPEPFSLGVRFRHEPHALHRYVLRSGSPADGSTINDLPLGEDFWISLVIRHGQLVNVSGATTLQAGDEIVALADPEGEADPGPLFLGESPAGEAKDAKPGPAPAPARWLHQLRDRGGRRR
ncbi:MAG: cation:proton antiporter [Sciscionella sp.]